MSNIHTSRQDLKRENHWDFQELGLKAMD